MTAKQETFIEKEVKAVYTDRVTFWATVCHLNKDDIGGFRLCAGCQASLDQEIKRFRESLERAIEFGLTNPLT